MVQTIAVLRPPSWLRRENKFRFRVTNVALDALITLPPRTSTVNVIRDTYSNSSAFTRKLSGIPKGDHGELESEKIFVQEEAAELGDEGKRG